MSFKHQECKIMADNINDIFCDAFTLKEKLENEKCFELIENDIEKIEDALIGLSYDIKKFDNHFVKKESKFVNIKKKLRVFYMRYLVKKALKESNHEM